MHALYSRKISIDARLIQLIRVDHMVYNTPSGSFELVRYVNFTTMYAWPRYVYIYHGRAIYSDHVSMNVR